VDAPEGVSTRVETGCSVADGAGDAVGVEAMVGSGVLVEGWVADGSGVFVGGIAVGVAGARVAGSWIAVVGTGVDLLQAARRSEAAITNNKD